jgi:hypothetical protein
MSGLPALMRWISSLQIPFPQKEPEQRDEKKKKAKRQNTAAQTTTHPLFAPSPLHHLLYLIKLERETTTTRRRERKQKKTMPLCVASAKCSLVQFCRPGPGRLLPATEAAMAMP